MNKKLLTDIFFNLLNRLSNIVPIERRPATQSTKKSKNNHKISQVPVEYICVFVGLPEKVFLSFLRLLPAAVPAYIKVLGIQI